MRSAIGIVRVSETKGRNGDGFVSPTEQRERIEAACERDGTERRVEDVDPAVVEVGRVQPVVEDRPVGVHELRHARDFERAGDDCALYPEWQRPDFEFDPLHRASGLN